MKKDNFKAFENVTNEELKNIAGGAGETKGTPSLLIPVSLAICPTTQCASIVKPCV